MCVCACVCVCAAEKRNKCVQVCFFPLYCLLSKPFFVVFFSVMPFSLIILVMHCCGCCCFCSNRLIISRNNNFGLKTNAIERDQPVYAYEA